MSKLKAEHDVIMLAKDLIARPSVTPEDFGCQKMMSERLGVLGFNNETMVFEDTTNLWSRRGTTEPVFCFAGHTDVVPAGNLALWHTPPFEPTIIDGMLYGRGAADMKGSLAAMLIATARFVNDHPDHKGSIAYLITSDEEGPFINGTTRVIDTLEARHEKINYCIVGEPTSSDRVGDIVKNGRRGSISGELIIHGKQGHVAYPDHVKNPIHLAMPALAELSQMHWDNGNAYFPKTSFQLSNIESGTGATNVVPGHLTAWFNLRFSTELNFQNIIDKIDAVLIKHQLTYEIKWTFNGKPFITEPGALLDSAVKAIKTVTNIDAELSTSGGTSDGRFIAPTGAQVIELGPCNATIHQVNESVSCNDLILLTDIYYHTLVNALTDPTTTA
ncbi:MULTISPECIES: succinyl-diaminopimelate desuccinylase [unclassified Colwellia]|jgi:succinyl-diaminopimelate desuccinylase|uniref:succinyl-diaminopimelate desuccinylase n=1 Tax=unclassified Colwellia TaxID=196834 RepID=UPI0015F44625|nr:MULTISPECIES: succinyl-diaminopimelate desuccinylase [unclassified Colwellia]MBA6337139.1 succinyl-diaminopimelate desuccinylase [Colwellia sp. BRX8-7]MBA6349236.1 succinyl-diaminopimelate desuccinylase [Colwellia sp. BRX8-9]MBA6356117.1 succinyl-diaminopimelate desuccinylase [Colwellia sp. BRX8-3]MBA6359196.1 succinyl-diaminopimelate desuccinylase [Colwellia sp. BRX8-6]MBA6368153.1 succinyl-diaminopimelate desuccinylase [Colwellia sp. BRX8-5]